MSIQISSEVEKILDSRQQMPIILVELYLDSGTLRLTTNKSDYIYPDGGDLYAAKAMKFGSMNYSLEGIMRSISISFDNVLGDMAALMLAEDFYNKLLVIKRVFGDLKSDYILKEDSDFLLKESGERIELQTTYGNRSGDEIEFFRGYCQEVDSIDKYWLKISANSGIPLEKKVLLKSYTKRCNNIFGDDICNSDGAADLSSLCILGGSVQSGSTDYFIDDTMTNNDNSWNKVDAANLFTPCSGIYKTSNFLFALSRLDGIYSLSVDSSTAELTILDSLDLGASLADASGLYAYDSGSGSIVFAGWGIDGLRSFSVDGSGNLTSVDVDDQGIVYDVSGCVMESTSANVIITTGGKTSSALASYTDDGAGTLTLKDTINYSSTNENPYSICSFNDQNDNTKIWVLSGTTKINTTTQSDSILKLYSIDNVDYDLTEETDISDINIPIVYDVICFQKDDDTILAFAACGNKGVYSYEIDISIPSITEIDSYLPKANTSYGCYSLSGYYDSGTDTIHLWCPWSSFGVMYLTTSDGNFSYQGKSNMTNTFNLTSMSYDVENNFLYLGIQRYLNSYINRSVAYDDYWKYGKIAIWETGSGVTKYNSCQQYISGTSKVFFSVPYTYEITSDYKYNLYKGCPKDISSCSIDNNWGPSANNQDNFFGFIHIQDEG